MRLTEGRERDKVRLPDGRVIPATVPIETLRSVGGIRQFQLTQEKLGEFSVRIIKNRGFSDTIPEEIKQELKRILGKVEINVVETDTILREKSGKLRQFISNLLS